MTYNISDIDNLRCSSQFLMPAAGVKQLSHGYQIYPSYKIDDKIFEGYDTLGETLSKKSGNFMLDGFSGVNWQAVRCFLDAAFCKYGIKTNWIAMDTYLKPETEINALIEPFLGAGDPLFGKIYPGELGDFFNIHQIMSPTPEPGVMNILYGCGAALGNWNCPLIYFDVPKNEIQFRSRAGNVVNLGASAPEEAKLQYKRLYFIDWVVLNKHKQLLLPKLEIMVDEQRPGSITWIKGANLRKSLTDMASNVFRARPWFEPGVWGGQWIKENIDGLNKDVVNYAWSFEFIAPENGIVFENGGKLLEISADCLLYNNNKAVLGKAAQQFGYKFPIRFDFLDTMNGDKLSLQCHPSAAYTKKNFGEDFTQDETYYILETGADAEVYLGFRENIDKNEFRAALEDSFAMQQPVDVKKYVQTFPAKKHDLFLIPNRTVHCSGKNNLVLEISATPYIYTFKMYDWLRPNLDGQPRNLNIDRAFENLDFEKKGHTVVETLISKNSVTKQGDDWRIVTLSTHPEHFYAIERLEFYTTITDITNDQCLVMNLVEGDSITVTTGNNTQVIHYAETFIIPASAGGYTMQNNGGSVAKVIKAFVK